MRQAPPERFIVAVLLGLTIALCALGLTAELLATHWPSALPFLFWAQGAAWALNTAARLLSK